MENLTWGVVAIGTLVGGLTMMLGLRKADQKLVPSSQIDGALKQDWTRTGNIDFHASALESSSPQPLTLRVEEKRIKESAVGQDVIELRWRLATLEEGKELVICWNAKQADRIFSHSKSALIGADGGQRESASSQELLLSRATQYCANQAPDATPAEASMSSFLTTPEPQPDSSARAGRLEDVAKR